jgi:hypothetical protein
VSLANQALTQSKVRAWKQGRAENWKKVGVLDVRYGMGYLMGREGGAEGGEAPEQRRQLCFIKHSVENP